MKKYLLGLLLTLLIATPVYAYTVRKGDTLYGLYGSKWPQIAAMNGITDPRKLQVGQELKTDELLGASIPTSPALVDTYLASGINKTDTSMTLADGNDRDGNALSGFMCLTIDVNTPVVEYVCGTASGTSITGLMRGLSVSNPNSTSSARAFPHRRLASVQNTDYPIVQILSRVLKGQDSTGANLFTIGDGINTNKTLRFDNGVTNTPEMVYDATTNQLKFRRSGETSYTEIPLSLRGTYPDYASLPTDASDGDIAITTDDYKLYTYNLGGTTWVLAGGSSGAGTVYKTNKLGSESDGGDLKTFSLTAGSWPSSNFLLVYKNGQSQREGASYDYTIIDSDTIQFTTTLASDDTVQMFVVSVDLYNPAWGSVNASIIPDTNNAYDLGTATKTFKDVYVTGTLYYKGVAPTSTATANALPLANASGTIVYNWLGLDVGKSGATTTTFTIGNTYQNTSGKSQFKVFTFSFSCGSSCGASNVQLFMDSSSTPTTLVGKITTPSGVSQGNDNTISVIVPNNYYYKAVKSEGSNVSVGITNIFTQNF